MTAAKKMNDYPKDDLAVVTFGSGDEKIEKAAEEKVQDLAVQAIKTKAKLDAFKNTFEEYKKAIQECVDLPLRQHGKVAVAVPGVGMVTVSLVENHDITDAEGLQEALGDQFAHLVKTSVTHKVTDVLMSMICDGDGDERLRDCVTPKESIRVNIKPEKPKKKK